MSNLESKFGPAPAYAHAPPLPAYVVLLGQLAVCVALLLVLQPPFVLAPGLLAVDMTRVLAASVATVATTWAMHACGAHPGETFRGACEVFYRAARA